VHPLHWLLSPAVSWIFTGPQNAKFKGSKYVSIKKPQYKKARENLGVYSMSLTLVLLVLLHEDTRNRLGANLPDDRATSLSAINMLSPSTKANERLTQPAHRRKFQPFYIGWLPLRRPFNIFWLGFLMSGFSFTFNFTFVSIFKRFIAAFSTVDSNVKFAAYEQVTTWRWPTFGRRTQSELFVLCIIIIITIIFQ